MKEKLKILILGDVLFDIELIKDELHRKGVGFSSKLVETEEDYIRELEEYKPDLILANHPIPHFGGLSALKIAYSKYPYTPFFFVSDEIEGEFVVEMFKEGATDYIFKNDLSKLVPAIHRALKEYKEEAKHRNTEKLLLHTHAELEAKVQEQTKELSKANKELRMEITKRKQLEEALQESENKVKEIIRVSPVPQFVVDTNQNVIYWNPALEKYSNIKADEIIGTKDQWKAFYSNERPCMADLLVGGSIEEVHKWYRGNCKRSKFILRYQGKHKRSKILGDACDAIDFFPMLGEKGKWLHFTAEAIRDTKGIVIGAVETLEDITEQIHAEDEVRELLEEKEVFLREIHQRVNNNLQRIISLLNLQSQYITDEKILDIYKENLNRVKSVAIIHEKLYQSENLEKINFGEYVNSLLLDLCSSYEIDKNLIRLNVDIKDVLLNINTAIPCGLIINELVTNSIKHGFPAIRCHESIIELFASPDGIKSEIDVKIIKEDEFYVMTVYDNGIGFPEDLNFRNTDSLGIWLVISLADQLGGTVELERENGTLFRITFKELKNKDKF